MAEVPSSPVAVASVVVEVIPEEDAANSRGLVPVADRVTEEEVTTEVAVRTLVLEAVALAGRIMTSLSATEMLVSTSSLSGSCLRRLISTVLPS